MASLNGAPSDVTSVSVSLTGTPKADPRAKVCSMWLTDSTVTTAVAWRSSARGDLGCSIKNKARGSVSVDGNARRIGRDTSILRSGPKEGYPPGSNVPSKSRVKPTTSVKDAIERSRSAVIREIRLIRAIYACAVVVITAHKKHIHTRRQNRFRRVSFVAPSGFIAGILRPHPSSLVPPRFQ